MSKLSQGQIQRIVNDYIGVNGGYLGDFSYRSHSEFYPQYCDLDISTDSFQGTTRERFIAILSSLGARDQSKVVHGILKKYPFEESQNSKKSQLHGPYRTDNL